MTTLNLFMTEKLMTVNLRNLENRVGEYLYVAYFKA